MSSPRAGTTSRRSSSSRRRRSSAQIEALRQGAHQLVTHRPECGKVGDIVLVESAAGEHGILASEEDIWYH
jgi:hypothetical protein